MNTPDSPSPAPSEEAKTTEPPLQNVEQVSATQHETHKRATDAVQDQTPHKTYKDAGGAWRKWL